VCRRAPVRLARRARILLVRGISPEATVRRTRPPPALPTICPPRRPRAKSPRARTGRAKTPVGSRERPHLWAPPLALERLGRAGARSPPGMPPARSRTPGVRVGRRALGRPSRSSRRCNRPSRGNRRRLSHDRNRRPAAKLRALPRLRSLVLNLHPPQGLPRHSRPLAPYPYGIRPHLLRPSNPFGRVWGLVGRPITLRRVQVLRLSGSNPRRPPRSRSSSAQRLETSPALQPVRGPR
jgi:hypothetical protein